jgi:23S rRNA (adenine2503-C2)-methyltransferase
MKILKQVSVPTGDILIVEGEKGIIECLSLGDYGKDINLNQHKKVEHTDLLPLNKKWVCTISTQYGCSMGCKFCDVPKVGPGININAYDLVAQVNTVRALHPEIDSCERFNIHFARMGEPTWNLDVLVAAHSFLSIPRFKVHPVVSTMMPRNNKGLTDFLKKWVYIKNELYVGEAGLQISINSTCERERFSMFNGNSLSLSEISYVMSILPPPKGRKYTLNFAIAGYTIDENLLALYFPPHKFICKLTSMHKTSSALENNIETQGDYTDSYPYEEDEYNLKKAGFEVLVFIASKEEDESRITCGNVILADGGF